MIKTSVRIISREIVEFPITILSPFLFALDN